MCTCISETDEQGRCLDCGKLLLPFENPDPTKPEEMRRNLVDLAELFARQSALQQRMGWPDRVGSGKNIDGFRNSVLALVNEAMEALDETPWKPWKPANYKQVDRKALATEMTDVLQFWANACLYLGLSPLELTDALRGKWQENLRRIEAGETARGEDDGEA